MTLILIVFVIVLGVSFLCSLLEAVFLSVTPAYVAVSVKNSRKSGLLLQHLKKNIDRPISAILTLNTVSHTAGSAAIGALVFEQYGDDYLTMTSVILTLGILILSEIIPKTIGASNWKVLAPFSAYTIQLMIFALYPFVIGIEYFSKIFKSPHTHKVTREEMIMTAELGVSEGTLLRKESLIIKNLLMLDNIFVADIMTPRSVIMALDADLTVEEVAQKYKPIRFSRIPVFKDSLDNIIGLTHRYKLLETLSRDLHDTKVSDLTSQIQTVSEKMTVASAIDYFIKSKEHLALAVDEYGVVTGLVTLEDAVETLLGVEIVDEFDSVTDMRQYALEQWQIRKNQIRKM